MKPNVLEALADKLESTYESRLEMQITCVYAVDGINQYVSIDFYADPYDGRVVVSYENESAAFIVDCHRAFVNSHQHRIQGADEGFYEHIISIIDEFRLHEMWQSTGVSS